MMPGRKPRLTEDAQPGVFALSGWDMVGMTTLDRSQVQELTSQGDTRWNQQRLERELEGFVHHELDIRDREGVARLIAEVRPQAIIHAAAQPSHDRAAAIPFDDFDTNATGTLTGCLAIDDS